MMAIHGPPKGRKQTATIVKSKTFQRLDHENPEDNPVEEVQQASVLCHNRG